MSETPPPSGLPRGLIRRSGTPTNSGAAARLPTIRTPRDLTLGGRQKRTFTPNIPVRREKKEEVVVETSSGKKSQDRAKGRGSQRGRGRGRGRQDVIQSHSVFELGPSERLVAKPGASYEGGSYGGAGGSGGGGGRGGGRGGHGGKGGASIKSEAYDTVDSKRIIDDLLVDNFIEEDLEAEDPSLVPIRLPLGGPVKQEHKVKDDQNKPTDQVLPKVKTEPGLESMEDSSRETTPSPGISGHGSRSNWATTCQDLFMRAQKSESGEFLFIQMPDVLPGEPKTSDERKSPQENADAIAEKLGLCSLADFSEGFIGKLQIRKSGRTQLVLGNMALDVAMGTPPGFLQDVVSVRLNGDSSGGDMAVLGHIGHKLVCTPDFEHLLKNT